MPACALGVARRVLRGEVGFRLDNAAGHDAVGILSDELRPQECLCHGHGVTIVKGAREYVSLDHQPSVCLGVCVSLYGVIDAVTPDGYTPDRPLLDTTIMCLSRR
jgi:hypothetical protein